MTSKKQSMHFLRGLLCLVAVLAIAACAQAQREHRQPLTEAQIEKVREAAIKPNERIKLYTQFLDERSATLKDIAARPKSPARSRRMDDELQDFTALLDELASNLDQYSDRKADMRPALKKLNEDCAKWLDLLKSLPTEPSYDTARKEALESGKDLADDAKKTQDEQMEYFAKNKKAQGQERAEPE